MDLPIPHPERKRALILVDLQPGFVTHENEEIIPRIQTLIQEGEYSLIVESVFSAPVGSLWDTQVGWTFPKNPTVSEIAGLLGPDTIRVEKSTKSVFKGNVDLVAAFRAVGIEEVHLVGIDASDCVLTSAEESFDLGFFTYVIEECIASSVGEQYKEKAIDILREVEMTNHSSRIASHRSISVP